MAVLKYKKDGVWQPLGGGSGGRGIASVEQTAESQESGGENVLTITLTDGTKTDFIVRNGSGMGTVTETVESDNLFDPSIAIRGGLFYPSASGFQVLADQWSYYAYVPLRGAGIYRTILNWSQHEYTGGDIALLKEDKSLSQIVSGTYTATEDRKAYGHSFVVTQEMIDSGACYIGFDCDIEKLGEAMIVKNRDYPEVYIPFGEIEKTTTVGAGRLFEKTALFFGDSICAGTTIEVDAKKGYGWAGLIGVKNYMDWKNYGKDGGTVTDIAEVNSGLWLSTQVTNAIAEYPEADYLILEGGCNDADLLHEEGLGEISADYVNFDGSTFSGALEALILRLLTAYPKAKLAYVIPQKMGGWGTNFNGRIYGTYFERAKEICKKWGVPVLDLWNECPLNPLLSCHGSFYTDGQHLTLAGYEYITPRIEAFMEGL